MYQTPKREKTIIKYRYNYFAFQNDYLASEEPLEIQLAYGPLGQRQQMSLAVTMRTPGADFDLVYGFLFTEGLIQSRKDVLQMRYPGVQLSPEAQENSILVVVLVRKGASGMLGVKMVGNILLDGVVGSVPLLGDLFDIRYKANYRNVQLMKEHYAEGKHGGSAWWVIFLILGALMLMLFLSIYVVGKLLWWIFS